MLITEIYSTNHVTTIPAMKLPDIGHAVGLRCAELVLRQNTKLRICWDDEGSSYCTSTTIELIITSATFTTSLLKIGGDIYHRRFILRIVGEIIFTTGSSYEPLVKMRVIIIVGW